MLDTLLQTKPTYFKLTPEPKYEIAIDDATEHTERDRQFRNNQLKLQWELKCQKIKEAGILCGERPWTLCARNVSPFSILASELKDVVS